MTHYARRVRGRDARPSRPVRRAHARGIWGRLPPGRPECVPRADAGDDRRPVTTAIDEVSGAVPPRESWPEPLPHTDEGRLLTELIVTTFRLNGRLLDVARELAAEGGITAAWWQVLGGVLDEPRTVAEIGRRMGLTRQAVQRIADLLVDRGLAEYRPNPNHRRANLLACTEATGRSAASRSPSIHGEQHRRRGRSRRRRTRADHDAAASRRTRSARRHRRRMTKENEVIAPLLGLRDQARPLVGGVAFGRGRQ